MTVHFNPASFASATLATGLGKLVRGGLSVGLELSDSTLATALRDGLRETVDLHEAEAAGAVVIVTDRADGGAGRLSIRGADPAGGGRGELLSDDPELILAAIRLVAAGYSLQPPVARAAAPSPARPAPHLSPRERQVATLLIEGASNKLIARALDISVHTAKFHVTAVLEKLGARNRADAVGILLRTGLLPA